MTPGLAFQNVSYRHAAYAKHCANFCIRETCRRKDPDSSHGSISEFSVPVSFTSSQSLRMFSGAVCITPGHAFGMFPCSVGAAPCPAFWVGIPAMSSTFCRAALTGHVCRVVGVRSKPKMGRVDARRIVASMKDTKPRGDWTVKNPPRNPMRPLSFECSVSVAGKSTSPKPTWCKIHFRHLSSPPQDSMFRPAVSTSNAPRAAFYLSMEMAW